MSLLIAVLLEAAAVTAGAHLQLSRLCLLTVTRTIQLLALAGLAVGRTGGLHLLGLGKSSLVPGIRQGLIWSAGFAVAAGMLFLGLWLAGLNPLLLVRSPLPTDLYQRILFFGLGGIVAPVFEEVIFRGLIFGYLRRWNVPAAVLISTALFAIFHLPTLPVTQIVGGVVFAIAYQMGGSLMAPIVIHMLGNLAIFTLSLPWLQFIFAP